MKILGISLGHDTNFSLIVDGEVINVYEAERFYRKKRYKLHTRSSTSDKLMYTYHLVKKSDLIDTLVYLKNLWGSDYDCISIQNQGRTQEVEDLKVILQSLQFTYKSLESHAHHLSHASSSFFTSSFEDALILSFDGAGNDGQTLIFHAKNNKINYIANYSIRFGQSYNNTGYIAGLKPDVSGSTSGKLMGLTSYGKIREEWREHVRNYITQYRKIDHQLKDKDIELNINGKYHVINSGQFSNILELKKHTKDRNFIMSFLHYIFYQTKHSAITIKIIEQLEYRFNISKYLNNPIKLGGDKDNLSQDLAKTVQSIWTEEVLKIVKKHSHISKNFCIVGGCALNGIANYAIEKENIFDKIHYIPNSTDCGLSIGAALLSYHNRSKKNFVGYGKFFSPYLGDYAYDLKKLPEYKKQYSYIDLNPLDVPQKIAKAIYKDSIIGIIRGRYEIGPRALGNRSILCNPTNPEMREILNRKVKKREWYRPFAPVSTVEESKKYFTNNDDIPYMSVICDTKEVYRKKIPSVTHVDGTARLQTVSEASNKFLWNTINEFQKLSSYPILLNTSFNPGGEPILNFCHVGLSMLDDTELDFVLIENTIFSNKNNEAKLRELF